MSDQKPIILAATAAALALAANATAAAIAIFATGQPEAVIFGAIGLAAAFIGLVTITLWACYDVAPSQRRRDQAPRPRVFTPWSEAQHDDEAPHDDDGAALELFEELDKEEAAPITVAVSPASGGAAIIFLADWVKTHEGRRVHA
jgi:hypothetical protein